MNPLSCRPRWSGIRPMALSLLLAGLLGCQTFIERSQQNHVVQDMQAMQRAALQGSPIPELSSDPSRHGKYRILLAHFKTSFERLISAEKQIERLTGEAEKGLAPKELTSPGARKVHRAELVQLESGLHDMARMLDEVGGSEAERAIRAMPLDPDFLKGTINGLRSRRGDLDIVIRQLERKRTYYTLCIRIIDFAEAQHARRSEPNLVGFPSQGAADQYNRLIQELRVLEAEVNAAARQVQAIQSEVWRKTLNS